MILKFRINFLLNNLLQSISLKLYSLHKHENTQQNEFP